MQHHTNAVLSFLGVKRYEAFFKALRKFGVEKVLIKRGSKGIAILKALVVFVARNFGNIKGVIKGILGVK